MFRTVFLLIPLLFFSFDQPKLVKTKVGSNITVSIPENWKPMDALDFTERYPSVRAPLAAFTNYERSTDFSVNISATQWPDANAELAQKFFKASLINLFDRVEILEEGIHTINKKKLVYFKFESRVSGNKAGVDNSDPVTRYSYVQYLIDPKQTLVFSFSCPKREKEDWQALAESIMNSIKVK